MRTMLRPKFLPLALILGSCAAGYAVPSLEGQITILHGDLGNPNDPEAYSCSLSGLKGMGSECGTKYDEMVFTARILSIAPAPNDNFRLTLRPETIFKGAPTLGMEILTEQRRCLPEMKLGDSWLFSLYREKASKELIVNYGSRSGPEADEGKQIEFLRKLATLEGRGVVKGRAYSEVQGPVWTDQPSANHTVVLTRLDDGRKMKALTNEKGEFEFEPVLAGKYDLDPNTKRGLWTMWSGGFEVEPHGCTSFDLDFHVDGQIAGKLVFPAGIDPSTWQVEAASVNIDGAVSESTWTDDEGRFVLHGLSPGRYIVAFKKTELRKGPNLRVDLFAPGTLNQANARIIELGKATRVEGVQLVVPSSAIVSQ